jgi:hypothetical protein
MSGQITGTVTGTSGNTISGASVIVKEEDGTTILASTTTATGGTYEFTGLAAGNYAVTAKTGNLEGGTVCTVKDGKTTTNNIELLPNLAF